MRILFSLMVVLLSVAFVITGAVYMLARFVLQYALQPGSKAWKKAIDKLRDVLRPLRQDLIPWEPDTLSLLALQPGKEKRAGFWSGVKTNGLSTIYQEPVLALIRQGNATSSVTVVQSADREYVFRRKNQQTEIWVNGQGLGIYAGGILTSPSQKGRALAQVDLSEPETNLPVRLAGQTVATFHNPDRALGPNPRAFTLLRDLKREEEDVVLAIGLAAILEKTA